jgi:copper(I)-binding protein
MRAGLLCTALTLALAGCDNAPELQVAGYARPTVEGQSGSAAYLQIRNVGRGDDRLLAVTSPQVGSVSLHQSNVENGIMRMRSAEAPGLEAGETLTMSPGGLHLMLMGLKAPLRPGTRLPLTLSFERSAPLRTTIPIQMSAPDDFSAR